MELSIVSSEATTTIALSGWLDTTTSPQLSAAIEQISPNCKELVLDFADLEYISSAGIRVLVATQKMRRGQLTLTHVSSDVLRSLHLVGLDKLLNIT